MMEFLYLLIVRQNPVLDDMSIFVSKEDAIQKSIEYPNSRVEIFAKSVGHGYVPTYNYYKSGVFTYNVYPTSF